MGSLGACVYAEEWHTLRGPVMLMTAARDENRDKAIAVPERAKTVSY